MWGSNERVLASLGFAFRVIRARFLRVRQEAEGGRPTGLRADANDLSVFRFQHHPSCRDRGSAHRSSLLCQNLSHAVYGQRVFKSFNGSAAVSTTWAVASPG